jgi:hypothetical protein
MLILLQEQIWIKPLIKIKSIKTLLNQKNRKINNKYDFKMKVKFYKLKFNWESKKIKIDSL